MSAIPASAAAENDIVVHEDDFDENGTIDAVVVSSLSRRRRHRLPRLLLKGTPVVEVLLKVDFFGANDVNDDVNNDENCEYNTTVFVVVIVVAFFIVVVVVVLLLLLRASSRKISFLPNDDDDDDDDDDFFGGKKKVFQKRDPKIPHQERPLGVRESCSV